MFIKSRTALLYVTDAYNSFQSLRLGLKLTLPFKFLFFFPHFFSFAWDLRYIHVVGKVTVKTPWK